jgi:hypothetical protein
MSHADTRRAIESRFQTEWAASAYSAIPVWYENAKFTVPTTGAYVALSIIDTGSEPADIAGTFIRYTGTIQADIIVPENTGTQTARQMADVIAGIYRRAQFSCGASGTINCRAENIRVLPAPAGRYRCTVRVNFYRDYLEA